VPERTPNAKRRTPNFFDHAREPLFLLNARCRLLAVNAAWEQLTGLSAAQARDLACAPRAAARVPHERRALARALCPPREVMHGQIARVRRRSPSVRPHPSPPPPGGEGQGGGGGHWWDVEFLPLHEAGGRLRILGKIAPVATEEPAALGQLPDKVVALRTAMAQRYGFDALAGSLPVQQRLIEQVRLASRSRVAVLLLGEAGTGKHGVARTIHHQGDARDRVFAALDCRRLPAPVLAVALFAEDGLTRKPGVGTLYLREPAFLPRELQDRLCGLLGDPSAEGPRLIAGCCTDPAAEVRAGRLLEELRCALSTLVIEVPPLRERWADLPRLVERLLEQVPAAEARPPVAGAPGSPGLTPAAWDCLRGYPWPGNVRELRAALVSARAHAAGERIDVADLPAYLRRGASLGQTPDPAVERPLSLAQVLEQVERRLIQRALERARGNKSRAAELLSVWRPRLLRRMQALGLSVED
jgi:transcriptional regulator with PAS, ATPase and Fis domain